MRDNPPEVHVRVQEGVIADQLHPVLSHTAAVSLPLVTATIVVRPEHRILSSACDSMMSP